MASNNNPIDQDATLKQQAERVRELADDINPREDTQPDSEAEATTVPLEDGQLGGSVSQKDAK